MKEKLVNNKVSSKKLGLFKTIVSYTTKYK